MNINIGVIGASSLEGIEIIKCIEQLNDKRINIFCYASKVNDEVIVQTDRAIYKIEELNECIFTGLKYVIFAANGEVSDKYAKIAVSKGCIVIDCSPFYRMHEQVPLISIGSNDEELFKHKGLISSPSSSVVQLMRSLRVIDGLFGIKKVVVSTYQSVSEMGKNALEEYTLNQYIALPKYKCFPTSDSEKHYSIKDNIIPQIEHFDMESGYTQEELKIAFETKKILGNHINVSSTCVRVPTYRGSAQSIYVETENEVNIELLKSVVKEDQYLELKDNIEKNDYPLVNECYYNKKAIIGRIRKDLFNNKGLHYFIVGDNLYTGSAYNVVMILYSLIKEEYNV